MMDTVNVWRNTEEIKFFVYNIISEESLKFEGYKRFWVFGYFYCENNSGIVLPLFVSCL